MIGGYFAKMVRGWFYATAGFKVQGLGRPLAYGLA